ncbi:HSP20-like chaperone [Neocallimastix lanati (nom. inval.)]|jgi:HSP20 family protein|nr:HSP20-like chaperone [Neocallimastix sp. JGI-2020a]
MSLFIRRNHSLLGDSFFNDFENDFFENHPLITINSLYPYPHFSSNPIQSLENKVSKVFKSVDFNPKINLSEDEKHYYIHADLPGLTKDQVKMELSDDDRILTISGERETVIDHSNKNSSCDSNVNENKDTQNSEQKEIENGKNNEEKNEEKNNKKYSRIECNYGKFSRSFSIPENVSTNDIQAKMENGVLEVTLNKIEPPKKEQTRSIQIQ